MVFLAVLACLLATATVVSSQDNGHNFTEAGNVTDNFDNVDYPTSVEETKDENTELQIIGDQVNLPFSSFPGINPALQPTLKTIEIERLELEPATFIDSLRRCHDLEKLYLDDVYWNDQFTTKLELPKLKRFVLYQKNWDVKTSTADSFMSTLFFHTNQSKVKTDVNRVFSFNPDESELEIYHLPYDISHHFWYTSLILWDTVLNVPRLNKVITLKLNDVKLIGGGILEILEKCAETEDLEFKLSNTYPLDLAMLPAKHLKQLSLSNMILSSSAQHAIRFEALKSLELSSCEFNLSLFWLPESLNDLILRNVTIQDGNLSTIIQNYRNIATLTLANMTTIDLAVLSHSQAREFEFSNSYLTHLKPESFEFENIFSLKLTQCQFDELFIKKFSLIFRKMRRFTIKGDFSAFQLLKELLNTSVTVLNFHLEGNENQLRNAELQEGIQILSNLNVPLGETQFSLFKWENGSGWEVLRSGMSLTQNRGLRDALILLYILPISLIAFIGIFGNVVSGLVLCRKRLRSSTSCILLGLTLSDFLLIGTYSMALVYFGLKLILIFLQFQITDVEYPFLWFTISVDDAQWMEYLQSHFLYSINKTAYTGSVYCTILVTLERYIAVCWPLRARGLLSIKRSMIATISVLVFSILLNGPRWLEGQVPVVVEREKNIRGSQNWIFYRDTTDPTLLMYTNYRLIYHGWIWITLMYALPVNLLVFLNYKIWKQLGISKAGRASMTTQNRKSEEEQAALTRMLLCIITLFVVCNLVNGVVVWGFLWYGDWDRWEPSDIEVFSCIPLIINSSANFIIYCLMGNRFRRELIKMLPKCLSSQFGPKRGVSITSQRQTESTFT